MNQNHRERGGGRLLSVSRRFRIIDEVFCEAHSEAAPPRRMWPAGRHETIQSKIRGVPRSKPLRIYVVPRSGLAKTHELDRNPLRAMMRGREKFTTSAQAHSGSNEGLRTQGQSRVEDSIGRAGSMESTNVRKVLSVRKSHEVC